MGNHNFALYHNLNKNHPQIVDGEAFKSWPPQSQNYFISLRYIRAFPPMLS